MGKFNAEFRRLYWLQRFLDTVPDPPKKEVPFAELTDEQKVARYCHRAFYILTGEKFDKKKFNDMMRPPQP